MLKIFADFETFYDDEYSLTNMTSVEYILDPRFEMICAAIAVDNKNAIFLPQEEPIKFLRSLKEHYAFISYNALFDAAILAFRYNIHPAVLLDSMSMARAFLVHKIPNGSLRLANVLEFLGLEAKGTTIKEVKGLHFEDISKVYDLWLRFRQYNIRDVNGCREIYNLLAPNLTRQEARVMDTVIRMVTQPRLILNQELLNEHLQSVLEHKRELLERIGANSDEGKAKLMSNQKFAELLRWLNVEPPMKISPTTGQPTYAFAKTDQGFLDLLDHPDEHVVDIVEARMGIKSTLEETRAKRLISIAISTTNSYGTAWLPVPLKYSGTHTHRFSGDWNLNLQNLSARKNKKLRQAIEAPEGFVIVAVDAAQIEARLVAWLVGEQELLRMFAEGIDVYKDFAADIYYKTIEEVTKVERFNAKTCILGLGYSMSEHKLLKTITISAKDNGFDVQYNLGQCFEWVNRYRTRFARIPQLWVLCSNILTEMCYPNFNARYKIGPCYTDGLSIVLPSKLRLNYHNLTYHKEERGGYYTYQHGKSIKKIYGAKLVENIVQALDRQHVIEASIRTEDRCRDMGNLLLAHQMHDENIYVVHKDYAEYVARIAYEEMCRQAEWALGLPLAAEVKIGRNYGELEELKFT